MAPKKKAADDGEDLSIEQFWKTYKKNCASLDIPICKIIKERFETDYLEEGNPIVKVSLRNTHHMYCDSLTFGNLLDGKELKQYLTLCYR